MAYSKLPVLAQGDCAAILLYRILLKVANYGTRDGDIY